MKLARTWKLQFNLDEFNSEYMGLSTDQDKAQWLCGFGNGLNNSRLREGVEPCFASGYGFGKGMRDEAEAFRANKSVNGAKGGRPRAAEPAYGAEAQPVTFSEAMVNQSSTQSTNPISTIPDIPPSPNEGRYPLSGARLGEDCVLPGQSCEEILGGVGTAVWEDYWRLVAVFGERKNGRPKETAALYVEALKHGAEAESILARAKSLKEGTSDPRYMPGLARWLSGQGYLNPLSSRGSSVRCKDEPDSRAEEVRGYLAKITAQREAKERSDI